MKFTQVVYKTHYCVYSALIIVLLSVYPAAALDLNGTIFSKVGEEQRIDHSCFMLLLWLNLQKVLGRGTLHLQSGPYELLVVLCIRLV